MRAIRYGEVKITRIPNDEDASQSAMRAIRYGAVAIDETSNDAEVAIRYACN